MRRGHEVRALTVQGNARQSGVPTLYYAFTAEPVDRVACRLGRSYTEYSDRGVRVARACLKLRQDSGYVPDVIFGHSGWGETLFLKEVWPEAKLIVYAEFYYRGRGADVGFDTEFVPCSFDQQLIAQGRAAHLGQSLLHADAGLAPTQWQASTYPPALRRMITTIFDGVDTQVLCPDPAARLTLPGGREIRAGDEVLTFVNRSLEPYRGYHSFMRALPAVMAARPDAQVVIVGAEGTSYGAPPRGGGSWKELFLNEVRDRLDMSRLHFLGRVPYGDFVRLLQISRAHAYLTYPFVLSWSMMEAMGAGALVIGSDTAPVREMIRHGENGLLVDFFDIEGWSRILTEALADPARFAPLRVAARQMVVENYDLHRVCLPKLIDFAEGFAPPA